MQSGNPLLGVRSNGSWACRFGSYRYIGEYPFRLKVRCPDFTVQRRFAHEHSQFLDRQWAEDEEYDPDNTGGTNTPSERVDLDNTSQSSGTTSTTTRSRKRRRTSPHSRQASTPQLQTPPLPVPFQKGSDFWTMVDKWFLTRMQADQLGTPWSSPGWIK